MQKLQGVITDNNQKFDIKNQKIVDIATEIAKITPENDFMAMFETLADYTSVNALTGNPNANQLVNDISNNPVPPSGGGTTSIPVCNCRWFCGNGGGSGECRAGRGCGFAWLQDCVRYNSIMNQ